MPEIATATIKVDPDLDRLTLVMRVVAKHLTACADELDQSNTKPEPPRPIRAWKDGKVVTRDV